ncbi:glycosyltransferase family 1 protein [Sphingomonas sp. NSE70-1]|uniref:Glycosyltransferase family 1 protein n=1 Tax=Sphingomonas caseinilyticus TaxID=2908205 RepID=A0ABT0RTI1_9SPHN|nr:glycosyltransferase family 1 protein [Sphingomonas caseinilyticus]MCL6698315.1 glycosyltransferase family 1 protein [Sphingomonas caseinilyticus]
MKPEELRIALFSGNYNYVRDGANQALNRLVGYLLRQGAQVRVYSPTVEHPAFPPTGDLVSVPSVPIPGRPEYRLAVSLPDRVRRDIEAFNPNVFHVAAPDIVAHRAVTWARKHNIPVISSVHTRFDTYLQYYGLKWLEPAARAIMRRYYRRCDAIVVPAQSTAAIMRAQRMNKDISIWARGVDRTQFNPERRSLEWRRSHGIGDDEMVVCFLGRLVLEKGLDVFADAIDAARAMGVPLRVVAIGAGPAHDYFQERLPDAIFTGQLTGTELATALASTDVFLNPSITETFGNVTLEAMASGLPVMAAAASGTTSLVQDNVTGRLAEPGDNEAMANELADYQRDPALRTRHGAAGLEFAKTMDWDEINAVVMHVYERVIERRRRLAKS